MEKFSVSVNIASNSKVTFILTHEELLQRTLGQYEILTRVKPKEPVQEFKVNSCSTQKRHSKWIACFINVLFFSTDCDKYLWASGYFLCWCTRNLLDQWLAPPGGENGHRQKGLLCAHTDRFIFCSFALLFKYDLVLTLRRASASRQLWNSRGSVQTALEHLLMEILSSSMT